MITSTLEKIQNEQEDEEHMITSTLAKIQNVQEMKKIPLLFIFFNLGYMVKKFSNDPANVTFST